MVKNGMMIYDMPPLPYVYKDTCCCQVLLQYSKGTCYKIFVYKVIVKLVDSAIYVNFDFHMCQNAWACGSQLIIL